MNNIERMKVAFTTAQGDWSMRQEATGRVPSSESLREVAISGICLIKTKSSRQGNKLDTSTRHGTPNISSRPLPPVINKKERNSPLRSPTRPIFLPILSVPTKLLDTSISRTCVCGRKSYASRDSHATSDECGINEIQTITSRKASA